MRTYSMDLRERVVAALDEGESSLEVAARFGVSDSWVRKLRLRRAATGSIAPKPHGGGKQRCIDAAGEELLREIVAERNDAILAELCEAFAARRKRVSVPSMSRALIRMGLTLKKRASTPPSATPSE
jgi:transposase